MATSRDPGIPEPSLPLVLIKRIVLGVVGLIVLIVLGNLIFGSFYTVEQNEVAGVTRFGSLVSEKPEGPGFHWKAPFLDTVHKIHTSMDRLTLGVVNFKTMDNQFGSVVVNLSYRTGDPFRALYKVGDLGAGSIIDKVMPFISNRTIQVFGTVNALQITDQLNALQGQILHAVQEPAMELFGEKIEDVQLTDLKYSDTFEKNVELMVQTRNQQIQAENLLKVKQTEAEQAVAVAKGEANSAVAAAQGQRDSQIANAEGAAKTVQLNADAAAYARKVQSEAESAAIERLGNAQASSFAAQIKSFGDPQHYSDYIRATASTKWTGNVPAYQIGLGDGKNGGGQPVIMLPSPSKE